MLSIENCQICRHHLCKRIYSLPRFDLYVCGNCTHLFSFLKVAPETYEADYFCERYQEHFANPDIKLFNYLHQLIQNHLSVQPSNLKILDVGTAIGILPHYFHTLGYHSAGIDISLEAIAYGRDKFKLNTLQAVAIEDFQPEELYQIITNIQVIEHIPDPIKFLQHIERVLHQDGIFICTTIDSNSLIFTLAKIFYKLTGHKIYQPLERVCEIHHLHHFNQKSLTYALEQTGFRIVERFAMNLPLDSLTLTTFQRFAVLGMYGMSHLLQSYFTQGVVCRKSSSDKIF